MRTINTNNNDGTQLFFNRIFSSYKFNSKFDKEYLFINDLL